MDEFLVGDWALHKSGELDARLVTAVSEDGSAIWLWLINQDVGPFPAANYTLVPRRED